MDAAPEVMVVPYKVGDRVLYDSVKNSAIFKKSLQLEGTVSFS